MKTVKFSLDEVQKNPQNFYVNVARWLSEPNVTISFRGNPEKVKVVQEALRRTKEFQEALQRSDASLQTISEKLDRKHSAAEAFSSALDMSWPF